MIRENLSAYRPIEITCYSFAFLAGKIPPQPTDRVVFPPYVMDKVFNQNPEFKSPIMFEIQNTKTKRRLVCGVDNFDSPDFTYMPQWMMDYLKFNPGDRAIAIKTWVPLGKSVTFKPLQATFYTIENPKQTLEALLRNYVTLTANTTITFQMNTKVDGLTLATDVSVLITDLQPLTTVLIRDTDLNVEFEENPEIAPKYDKPKPPTKMEDDDSEDEDDDDETGNSKMVFENPQKVDPKVKLTESTEFKPFECDGKRLGMSKDMGKKMETESSPNTKVCPHCNSQVSAANFRMHTLRCSKMYKLCGICGKKLLINSEEETQHMELHMLQKCVQCGQEIEKQYMKKHLEEECTCRLAKCQFCSLMFPMKELSRHVEFCGNTMDECDKCGAKVPLNMMQHHKDYDCAFATKNVNYQLPKGLNFNDIKLPTSSVGTGNFECPMCENKFNNQVDLDTHILSFHPELYD
ncbi:ubiquitin fusion degradation protein, putative [Entamoeba invadens IP1]|uniref:Ubiquitin fusion degradation protein, putative n=1 Tax=Entamoeba invadens IP1 TaxID=370355 RepID=A0A0A1TV82_ENTIV|nr:ubiquitin fusion degradation protein, putative [Entamoeba invadens IP1]ELP84259.1 ubiquitin fusion degradation protein, putative [Entamoeba invadens IP1]|eukprot:XP_004183605.1 ubiquitin fusion degradation protein, putative [Entamoeba invadens IP1]